MNIAIDLDEIKDIVRLRKLWLFWGWLDIRQRYRRSFLGPFWVSMTMAVSIFATGFVYAYLFKQDVSNYLPYVATGFVLWTLISGYIGEACLVYIQNEGFINQLKLPLLIYPTRLLWRYIVMFMHHVLVLSIVLVLFSPVTWMAFFASMIGLVILCINLFWIGIVFGLVSVRLRDLPILISTMFQVLFLITPVIWPASALGHRMAVVNWNPFFHLMEVVRSPLLSGINASWFNHLAVTVIMGIFGSILAFYLLMSWRRRLIFWF